MSIRIQISFYKLLNHFNIFLSFLLYYLVVSVFICQSFHYILLVCLSLPGFYGATMLTLSVVRRKSSPAQASRAATEPKIEKFRLVVTPKISFLPPPLVLMFSSLFIRISNPLFFNPKFTFFKNKSKLFYDWWHVCCSLIDDFTSLCYQKCLIMFVFCSSRLSLIGSRSPSDLGTTTPTPVKEAMPVKATTPRQSTENLSAKRASFVEVRLTRETCVIFMHCFYKFKMYSLLACSIHKENRACYVLCFLFILCICPICKTKHVHYCDFGKFWMAVACLHLYLLAIVRVRHYKVI